MQRCFKREKIDTSIIISYFPQDVKIDVCAILNDTTGTLMSCAWKNRNCRIGLIVGTYTTFISQLRRILCNKFFYRNKIQINLDE